MKYHKNFGAGSVLFLGLILNLYPLMVRAQAQSENILGAHAAFEFRAKALHSECKPIIAMNTTSGDLKIESISTTDLPACFLLSDLADLPERIGPEESVTLGYLCFRPKSGDDDCTASLNVTFSGVRGKSELEIPIHGRSYEEEALPEISESMPGAIFRFNPYARSGTRLLSMVGKDAEFTRSFNFKNETDRTVSISAITFEKKDGKFEVSSVIPGKTLPMELAPDSVFGIRIVYHSADRRPCSNKLQIFTEDGKSPVSYDIRGLQLPLSQMDWNKKNQAGKVGEN